LAKDTLEHIFLGVIEFRH